MSFLKKVKSVKENNIDIADVELSYNEREYNYFLNLFNIKKNREPKRLQGRYAGFCPRLNYFLSKESTVEHDSLSSTLFKEIGNTVERVLIDGLMNNNKLLASNFKLDDFNNEDLNIGGIIDFIYKDNEHQITIGECKTIKDLESFKTNKQYIAQALLYSAITGIDKVNLFLVSRKVIEKFEQPIAMEIIPLNTSYDSLLEIMINVFFSQECIRNNYLPARFSEFRKTIECKHCPFIEQCYNTKIEMTEELEELHYNLMVNATDKAQQFLHYNKRQERLNKFLTLI